MLLCLVACFSPHASVSVLRTMGEELLAIRGKLRSSGMSRQRILQKSTVRFLLARPEGEGGKTSEL